MQQPLSSRLTTALPTLNCRTLVKTAILCLIVAASFLCVIELALWMGNVAPDQELFIANPLSDAPAYIVNPLFYYQYLSSLTGPPTVNEFSMWGFSIPQAKAPESFRIFIIGGSAAFGWPTPEFGYHRILEVLLNEAVPEIAFEVYNLACPVLNGHVMERVVSFCQPLEPDLFIVYMGNNEYDGPFGPAWHEEGLFANAVAQPLLRLSKMSRLLRWGAPLMSRFAGVARKEADPQSYFQHNRSVNHDSLSRRFMHRRFEKALRRICSHAEKMDAAVILSTVASNLKDWPPSASEHTVDLSAADKLLWKKHYAHGRESERAGLWEEAFQAYEAAHKIDAGGAALHFRLGKCFMAFGMHAHALEAFVIARDYDCYPYRADSRLNAIAMAIAAEQDGSMVFSADSELWLNELCDDGIAGNGMFYDNVHFLFPGNHGIATILFETTLNVLRSRGYVVPDSIGKLTVAQCRERLGLVPDEYRRHLEAALAEHETYKKLPSFQESIRDYDINWLKEAIASVHDESGALLGAAELSLETAIAHNSNSIDLYNSLVRLLLRSGDRDKALHWAERMVDVFAEHPKAQILYATALEQTGNAMDATRALEPLRALLQ